MGRILWMKTCTDIVHVCTAQHSIIKNCAGINDNNQSVTLVHVSLIWSVSCRTAEICKLGYATSGRISILTNNNVISRHVPTIIAMKIFQENVIILLFMSSFFSVPCLNRIIATEALDFWRCRKFWHGWYCDLVPTRVEFVLRFALYRSSPSIDRFREIARLHVNMSDPGGVAENVS